MLGLAAVAIGAALLVLNKERLMPENKTASFDDLYKSSAAKYGIPFKWLKGIAMNESSDGRHPSVVEGLKNPKNIEGSKSTDGKSWGIMQITLTTARDFDASATPEKLNNAAYSIDLAARYLSYLSSRFPTMELRYEEWVIKSYNQGPGNTAKERAGQIKGYAQEYWERYKRNTAQI